MNYSRSNLPLCRCNANYHKTSGQYELSKNLNHFHFILLALKDEYAYFSFIAIIIFVAENPECHKHNWNPLFPHHWHFCGIQLLTMDMNEIYSALQKPSTQQNMHRISILTHFVSKCINTWIINSNSSYDMNFH